MQTHWKINGQQRLLLFFSGWGMDTHATHWIDCAGWDVCTCFDYRHLQSTDIAQWKSYPEIHVLAWSSGVWAATEILVREGIVPRQAVALNGTPTTVHPTTGIPRTIFEATYQQFGPQTMKKFFRRMTGNSANSESLLPQRQPDDQKEELAVILSMDFEKSTGQDFSWTKAIIGTSDLIFPTQHQYNYWNGRCPIIEKTLPHYPFSGILHWEELLYLDSTKP